MGEQKKSKHTQKKEVCLFRFRIIFDPYKKLELIKKKKVLIAKLPKLVQF